MARSLIRGYSQIMTETIKNAQIATDAAIDTSKLASGAEFLLRDGSVALTGALDAGAFKITNAGDGTAAQDLVTKNQLDSVSAGLETKGSVKVSSIAALPAVTASGTGVGKTLTADAVGIVTLDGVDLIAANCVVGDRVLIKDEVAPANNGIYDITILSEAGVALELTRSDDFDGSPASEIEKGAYTFVFGGSTLANTGWTLLDDASYTAGVVEVDTDPLNFTQFQGKESTTASTGLTLDGNDIQAVAGNGILAGADLSINLDGSTLSLSASGIKLAALTDGDILVGNASNIATGVTMSGDVAIDNTGSAVIQPLAVDNSKIAAGAAIVTSKLADGALFIQSDGSVAMGAALPMGGFKLTGMADGTVATDGATYGQITTLDGDLQGQIDQIELATGLSTGGVYNTEATSNYLKVADFAAAPAAFQTEEIHNATMLLDIAIKANEDAITGLGAGSLTDIQNELDALETSFGNGIINEATGAWTGFSATNYIDASSDLAGAVSTLDGQAKTNADAINVLEVTTIPNLQTELDDTQAGAGLATNGDYIAVSGSNYIDASTSIVNAISLIDTAILVGLDLKLDDSQLIDDDTMGTATATNIPSAESVKAYVDNSLTAEAVGFVDEEVPTGLINGSNTAYTLAATPDPIESTKVYHNGQRLREGASNDFTISGTAITMAFAPDTSDQLWVDYRI
jgi:hypothetical protein